MDNASTEVSLAAHPEMVKEGSKQHPVIIFTKDNMDADKHVSVINLPPMRFIGDLSKQGITVNIQGAWYPDRLVVMVKVVGVLLEEAFSNIGINSRRAVIHLEFDGE